MPAIGLPTPRNMHPAIWLGWWRSSSFMGKDHEGAIPSPGPAPPLRASQEGTLSGVAGARGAMTFEDFVDGERLMTPEEQAEFDAWNALHEFGRGMAFRALPGQHDVVFFWKGRRYFTQWVYMSTSFGCGMNWTHPVLDIGPHLFLVAAR
jgi:hypothetical protein